MPGRRPAVQLTAAELDQAATRSASYRNTYKLTQQDFAHFLRCRVADISAIECKYHRRNSRVARAILDLSIQRPPLRVA